MGFAKENGYTPVSIETIMSSIMTNINTQFGTTYTNETFVGTNFYKYFYALAQELQESEVLTSEIFAKLQDYFRVTNERISRPVATAPGILEKLETEGYIASVKAPIDGDAGKIFVCVNVDDGDDDYAETKLDICNIIRDSIAAGIVSQGDQVESIVLTNGQSFDFKYALPDPTEVLLRLTITTSENNQVVIQTPEEIKQKLMDNIEERYRLGKNFEPQRYFSVVDAPWASDVLLEWSDDAGSNYYDTVFDAAFDDLFVVLLENIELIEA
jgi:hypothetical protein